MLGQGLATVLLAGSAAAFMPSTPLRTGVSKATSSALSMKLGPGAAGLIGSDLEFPEFDPLGFSNNPNPDTIAWYRAAELKHGRISMLASLGYIFQSFFHLPDAVFSESAEPWKALEKVYAERPLAVVQIMLAIFACEAIGQANQAKPGQAPGDLGFDPLNLKSSDPEVYDRVQLRELKNGRLAMLAWAGFLVQENLTGTGGIEQIELGHLSPFGDGQGFF